MWHPIDDHATKIGNQKMEKIVFSQSVDAWHYVRLQSYCRLKNKVMRRSVEETYTFIVIASN
jgi:hypothetical protein